MISREKIGSFVTGFIEYIYGIVFLVILFLVIFAAGPVSYSYKHVFPFSNMVYLFAGILMWCMVRGAEHFIPEKFRVFAGKNTEKLLIAGTLLFFLFLVYMVYNYYFVTGWDVETLVSTSKGIANGQKFSSGSFESSYFSMYPNNLFLVWIFSLIMKIQQFLGIGDGEMGILSLQCLLSVLTGFFVFKITYFWKKSIRLSWNAWGMYVMIAGVSPWVSIPYSDAMGIFFPVLILYLYMSVENGKFVKQKLFFMAAAAVLGYKIKPQIIIVLIAIFITIVIQMIQTQKRISRGVYQSVLILGIGFILAFSGTQAAIQSLPIEIKEEDSFGMAHFFMMGLNPVNNGTFLAEDVAFTAEQSSTERTKADLQVAGERIQEYGFRGMLQHLTKKMLTNYSDGTWSWGMEGKFYAEYLEDRNAGISPFLKSVYYNSGGRFECFSSYSQAVWMLVLCGGLCSFFFRDRGRQWDKTKTMLYLSILGLTAFELLFEARARYLYCYVPIYILIANVGLERFFRRLKL